MPITLDGVSLVAALVALRTELAGLVACRTRWPHLAPGSTRCGASQRAAPDQDVTALQSVNGTTNGNHRVVPVTVGDVRKHFESELQVGQVPGARAIQREMRVAQRTAARL